MPDPGWPRRYVTGALHRYQGENRNKHNANQISFVLLVAGFSAQGVEARRIPP